MTHEPKQEESIQQEIAQALQQAVLQHQTGQWQTAADLYLAILQVDPDHPDANHNQGILLIQTGSPSDALPYLLTALNAQPEQRQYWISYIDALIQTNNAKEAEQILALARQQGLEGEDVAALQVKISSNPIANTSPAAKDTPKKTKSKSKPAGNTKKLPTIQEINTLAKLFKQGQYADAITLAQKMTERYPLEAYGWKALGAAYRQMGRNAEALIPMQRALELAPSDTESLNNLANTLQNMGRPEEAIAHYQRAININPNDAEAHCNLGVTLRQTGRLIEAEISYLNALKIQPTFAQAHNNLGNILKDLSRFDEAAVSYRQALQLKPDYAAAYNNLGAALKELNQLDEAVLNFRQALKLNPAYAEAYNNLGNALRERGEFDEAIKSCQQALQLKPDYADAYSNLGGVLKELGHLNKSIESCQRALAINPGLAVAHNNMGNTLQSQGRTAEAVACYQQALILKPNYTMAKYNLGFSQLSCGTLREGWKNHEFRTCIDRNRFPLTPYWAGESLTGKAILIWGEQGVGDEIIFASLYAEVIAQAARCVIECAPKLLPLFTRSFPAATVVAKTEPPHPATLDDLDCQCAAGSLAQWRRPNLASFPLTNTFLIPDPARVAHWQQRLAELGPGPKIGFSWRSSLSTGERALSCTTLAQWEPIFRTPGVHFINLQYDECSAELAEATEKFGIPLHAFTEVDMYNDLDETAALARALDLVITAPTSIYALTAGLGVNTWVMTYGVPWLAHGTDHFPWFPSLRYFSRSWEQTWETVIGTIATQLPSPEWK